jgi:tryptophan synthase alpha chain
VIRELTLGPALTALREQGRKAFVPYLMAGFPSRTLFRDAARTLLEAGADALEIGVPFSDPLADGPAIQAAGHRALQLGVSPIQCLDLAREIHEATPLPRLILMTYTNTVLAAGSGAYLARARAAGIQGLIVPDLDLGDALGLAPLAARESLSLIRLLAPTTPDARARQLLQESRGFAYLVSVTGVTGARREVQFRLGAYIRRMQKWSRLPLYVGFGVSTASQAEQLCRIADGVIVGSALIETLLARRPLRALGALAAAIRRGCDRASERSR